jgi:predicted RNA-binding Zn-ribbon protein involved in translation (DUF1610 family)
MPRPRTTRTSQTAAKRTKAATSNETVTSTDPVKNGNTATSPEFVCPECGRTFTRAASLGAHRRQTHNIPGATTTATKQPASASAPAKTARTARRRRPRARRTAGPATRSASNGTNRDALLRTLFPTGIPAKESVIRSVNAWLDEAERLSRLR